MTDIKNKILKLVNKNHEYVLALSGGVDSAVLASIFKDLDLSYRTIFVNHNQKDSNLLQKSAEEIAKNLKTNHENIISDLEENASETKMREKRYGLLLDNLKKKKLLLNLLSKTEANLRKEGSLSMILGLRLLLNIKKITIS